MSKHKANRNPLRQEATWAAVVVGVGAVGSVVGVEAVGALAEPAKEVIQLLATGGALIAAPQVAVRRGEKHVTPVSDPRDNQGRQLGVVGDGTPPI